jgi:transposase
VAVSELCDKYEIAPSVFYKWQAQLFEQGEKVFEQSNNSEKVEASEYEKKIQTLEEKLVRKAEVV